MSQKKRGIRIQTRIIVSAFLLLAQILFLFFVLFHVTTRSTMLYVLSLIAGILTVIFIVNRRGNPSYKITWIIFILIFPVFGISVFLLWGSGRVLPRFRKKMQACEAHYLPLLRQDPLALEQLLACDRQHSRQADYLKTESGYPLYDRTSTEYLSPGEVFFPRLLAEVEAAKRYIYMEFFILAEGSMWEELHAILKKKAAEGVEVKIIFDDFGSIKRQHEDFITRLSAENIRVSVFNPIRPSVNLFMNNRNHRKIVVIDGETAITGGFNIGDEYINREIRFGYWLDSAIVLKGLAAKSFVAMFCCMWEFTTNEQILMETHVGDHPVEADGFVLPYCDGPLGGKNPAEGIYMQILNTATDYVYIASPYLIIDSTMMSILRMASKSGVDVRIVTPHIPDKWYVHPATQYNYLELLENGIRIYEYAPGFIHSKLFVSDDRVATVGTVNMDYRSFNFHFECGVWLSDSPTVLTVREQFEQIFEVSKEIQIEEWKKRSFRQRLKQAVLHLFAPFM
ncbi:MAG: cardiolipin synthase [Clostridia bacterium]|nr:cardiolipin synthase [Clostridia bacterium]